MRDSKASPAMLEPRSGDPYAKVPYPFPPVYCQTWVSIVTELRKHNDVPWNEHSIDFVTFGCDALVILRFENGNAEVLCSDDPEQAAKTKDVHDLVEEKLKDGWTVGNRTTLCQYDPSQYFIEWKKGAESNFAFSAGTIENRDRISNVLNLVGNDAAARKYLCFSRIQWKTI